MYTAAKEVIFALQTQGMSQKGIAAQVRCSQSMVSLILNHTLKRIAHSNRFKLTASITHLWNKTMTSPVSRSTTSVTSSCGSMVFQARYPALSLSYPANRRKNVYSLHRSIPSGQWRTGSKSSSLMNQNSSWVMATRDLVFGNKSTKGTRRLV